AGLLSQDAVGNATGDAKRTCDTNCQRENPRYSGSSCPGATGRRHGPRNDNGTGIQMNHKTDDNQDSAKHTVPEAPLKDESTTQTVDADLDAAARETSEPSETTRDTGRDDPFYDAGDRHVPSSPPPRRGVSATVAWLALLLALLALA